MFYPQTAMDDEDIITFEKGERVISEGDDAAVAYIITKGEVRVFLEKDGKNVTLANLAIGDMFGETALFGENKAYGADVEVTETAELIPVHPEKFKEKLGACDPMIRCMFSVLMDRLGKTNQALLDSETREFMDIVLV